MAYDNTNRGAIWKNTNKKTDKHPDLTGSINVEGTDYWISAWKRGPEESEDAPVLRFAVSKKDHKQPAEKASPPDYDDDLPF